MKEIITRAEAISRGLKSYYTGKQCRYGHTSERITSDGSCRKCRNVNQAAQRREINERIKAVN